MLKTPYLQPTANSNHGRRRDWRKALRHASRVLVASDFDGTVAAIADDPAAVRPARGARRALAALARRADFAVVLVSGRSLADLRRRCPVAGVWYLGSHGNELAAPGRGRPPVPASGGLRPVSSAAAAPPALGALADRIERRLPAWPGVWLERKPWSLALHYRQAPQWASAVAKFGRRAAAAGGWRLVPGNCLFELLPSQATDKGRAVRDLRRRLGCDVTLYLGDDATDEDVFALEGEPLIGVHIGPPRASPAVGGVASGDGRRTATAAEFWLAGPAEAVELLRALLSLRASPRAPRSRPGARS